MLTLRRDLRVQQAKEASHDTFKATPKDVENKVIYEFHDGAWNFASLRNLLEGTLPDRNRVDNFPMEFDLGALGRKKLYVNARRLHQRSKGTPLTLLAFSEDAKHNGA